jgi:16S rRNA C1402 N4-methylase RsmH
MPYIISSIVALGNDGSAHQIHASHRVKKSFEAGLRDGLYADIAHEVIRPSPAERHDNPRSSPAKLRWARKAM